MKPEIEPSRFSRHFEMVGTPRGTGLAFGAGLDGASAVLSLFCPNPNREIVAPGLALATVFSACDAFAAASRLACASAAAAAFASAASARLAA